MQYSAIMVAMGAALALGSPLVTKADIEACLTGSGVPIDTKGSEGWNRDVAPFNIRVPYTPAAIAVAQTTKHIQDAVKCGKKLGVKVSAKSGGHSYASYGFGGENGHLVVELDRMYKVTLNDRNYAEVEPGTRLGHLATELWKSKRAISHGTCAGVGIGGHFLHGGFGFSSHKHGLALDSIYKLDVVLANGSLVTASEHENADLFWAMKGAGSNFGIVAKFYLRTFAAPEKLTTFGITLNWDKAAAIKGIEFVESYAKDKAPENINFRVADYGKGNPGLEGLWYGDEKSLRKEIEPLIPSLGPKAVLSNVNQTSWIDAVVKYSNLPDAAAIDYTFPSPQENFYSKSLALKSISGKPAENFVNYWYDVMNNYTEHFWFFQLDMHGGKNSAISQIKNSETAYAHRDKLWLIQFYDRQDDLTIPFATHGTDQTEWLDGWVKATSDPIKGQYGAYVNYADTDLSSQEAQTLYYGKNLKKLQLLKKKYDEGELFSTPQSIKPYGTKWGTATVDEDAP